MTDQKVEFKPQGCFNFSSIEYVLKFVTLSETVLESTVECDALISSVAAFPSLLSDCHCFRGIVYSETGFSLLKCCSKLWFEQPVGGDGAGQTETDPRPV